MRTSTTLRLITAGVALAAVSACGGQSREIQSVSPTMLVIPPAGLPGPGLCQVYDIRDIQSSPSQRCDGIEERVEPGSAILYRPKDGSRNAVVCYVSPAQRGLIYGADLFDIDTRRHVQVLIPRGGNPPEGGCPGAYKGGQS
jgi:hypothetical protein